MSNMRINVVFDWKQRDTCIVLFTQPLQNVFSVSQNDQLLSDDAEMIARHLRS